MGETIPVAIVQHALIFLDLQASAEKAIALADNATKRGVRVIAFGETWLPGYPAWLDHCSDLALWYHAPAKELYAPLRQNSIVAPGKETQTLHQRHRIVG